MRRLGILIAATTLALTGTGQAQTLNLVTAGDQNMVDYARDFLGPIFEKNHPGATVKAVGTGPADAGSQKIMEKLEAEKANASWDMDVVVIHQKAAGEMVKDGLLAKYAPDVPTDKLVTHRSRSRRSGSTSTGM
jgi:spermidine/putrescine-binding protein